jgi:5-methyltetrahydrofolate--homocysteine methyltransferase
LQGVDSFDAAPSTPEIARLVAEVDESAVAAVEKALRDGDDPALLLRAGVIRGLERIGEKFEAGEYFLGELIRGGQIAEKCIAAIDPHLPEGEGPSQGVVVIGAVKGDFHDIGCGLVAKQLELGGFEVHLLGVDIAAMTFIDEAQRVDADIIGLSAFLATTLPNCGEVIDYVRDMGLGDRFEVIIGGAQTSQEMADEMGADGWAPNAVEAVALCRNLVERRREGRPPG